MTFYLFWTAVLGSGAAFRRIDRRWIRRPALGVLTLAGIPAGAIMTQLSPFNFVDGGLYMQGILLSVGSGLALIGYVLAWLAGLAWRRFARRTDP
jgi:hypothetical protein